MAVLTINQKIDNVNNFINSIDDNRNSYYCFVSTPTSNTDTNVSVVNNSITEVEQLIYQNMIYGKKLSNTNVCFVTSRYDWIANTVYSRYDNNDPDLYSKNFFVITDDNSVYKCIYNGYSPTNPNGVPSTVKPSIKSTTDNFQTPDGYIWKYMYTCDPTTFTNFSTSNYIPVVPNTVVQNNAVRGTIDNLVLTNGGQNYQVFETGFLQNFVNNYVVQLPSSSSPYDNYYTGSSIYLKIGFGAGQLREIVSYSGLNNLLSVDKPFDYNINLKLSNINGAFNIGDLVSQKISNYVFFYQSGYFNVGDTVIQSDTGVSGTILHANTVAFQIQNSSNTDFQIGYPLYNTTDSGVQKNGKVDINLSTNSYYIISNTGTNFTSDYSNNQYIRVGDNANNNIRRIVSVNSSVIVVDNPFTTSVFGANNYLISTAVSTDSITSSYSEGSIVYVNINSAEINYSNVQPAGASFIIGESLGVYDVNNVSQGANGTLSFSNNNTVILNNVNGTINSNLYLIGASSNTKAYINNINSYPNITVNTIYGGFVSGSYIQAFYANSIPVANAKVISTYSTPDELTEYIISPYVQITGDGNGALAYCTVDLSSNNPTRSITSLSLINKGQNYTRANVSISSNTIYGNGASVEVQLSPVDGHGSDPYTELGAVYAGVSVKFDTAQNENYNFPLYGYYKNVGIIKNPLISDVILNLDNFDYTNMNISSSTGIFNVGEIVFQPSSNSAGIVVYSNSTFLQIKNTQNQFTANASGDNIFGLTSNYTANCKYSEVNYFSLSANVESISDITVGGSGQINQILSNTQIRLTDTLGSFSVGDRVYEPITNAYANIVSIYTSNGTIDSSANYGQRINQTARITLSSNTENYSQFEYVTQNTSFATGRVISTTDELDLVYNTSTPFVIGDVVYNRTTGSNAVVIFANNSSNYIKLSGVYTTGFNETTNKPFNPNDLITNSSNTKSTTINKVYNVLVVDDVNYISGPNTTPYLGVFTNDGAGYEIVGNTSGSVGYSNLQNSIKLPDLVRDTGKVVYFDNVGNSPYFAKTSNSTEQVKLIIIF